MRITFGEEIRDTQAVWMESDGTTVTMIDQRLIPFEIRTFSAKCYEETAWAIQEMVVRGAPTIGATAAYGLAQAVASFDGKIGSTAFSKYLQKAYDVLLRARPTAIDLKHGLDTVLGAASSPKPIHATNKAAKSFVNRIVQEGEKLANLGKSIITDGMTILTHCHTGALALVNHGSALGVIIFAHREGKRIKVLVDETRPRLQGARITAWELEQEGIEHHIISDNSAGLLMSLGEVDLVILGADRVVANGDFANKIGTYSLAVLAKENDIPFYTAFPASTFDSKTQSGEQITIEQRDENEVLYVEGWTENQKKKVQISHKGARALNFAFDVTPARYVTGYVTPLGVVDVTELQRLKNTRK